MGLVRIFFFNFYLKKITYIFLLSVCLLGEVVVVVGLFAWGGGGRRRLLGEVVVFASVEHSIRVYQLVVRSGTHNTPGTGRATAHNTLM